MHLKIYLLQLKQLYDGNVCFTVVNCFSEDPLKYSGHLNK